MQRIGVLGGISPEATMDFEARVHRVTGPPGRGRRPPRAERRVKG
jgi:aspartate/glutamate racemase